MKVTITLYLWWLWAYLAAGLVFWLPLERLAYGKLAHYQGQPKFWRYLWRAIKKRWWTVPSTIILWSLAAWEYLR